MTNSGLFSYFIKAVRVSLSKVERKYSFDKVIINHNSHSVAFQSQNCTVTIYLDNDNVFATLMPAGSVASSTEHDSHGQEFNLELVIHAVYPEVPISL